MKFHIAINLERETAATDMRDVRQHTLDMVRAAERGGFRIAWAAEHHALEMTIAPDPFQILTWWAAHTTDIRLGTAVVAAPYWHPIRLAGAAAFADLISDGRLEFGIGAGAYQREFDRMRPGLRQPDAWRYIQEMLPALKALWAGDYAHDGEFWSFPTATAVPKPLQKPHPPIWAAARAPIAFDYAVKNNCNIVSWPLTRPFDEVVAYKERLETALRAHPDCARPQFAVMRHTAVYADGEDWRAPVRALQKTLGRFENLFRNLGDVVDGFPKEIPLAELNNREEYAPQMLHDNLMFGAPDEVIAKLRRYEELGVDAFIYYASFGLGMAEQKRSLELFCREVIPAFA